jgi:hypothetical protein
MTWVPWSSRRLAADERLRRAASGRPDGTTTCSATADRRSSPGGSARWRACSGPAGYAASPAQVIDATRLADTLATCAGDDRWPAWPR